MEYFISILGPKYVFREELAEIIEKIAYSLTYSFIKYSNRKVGIYLPDSSVIEISMPDKKDFQENYDTGAFAEGYSQILYCTVAPDDTLFIPFLKELFKVYEDLLVYNDAVEGAKAPYIFSKVHIDGFTSSAMRDCLFQRPVK